MPSSNIESRAETQHFLQKKHKLLICEIILDHKLSCSCLNFCFPISYDDRSNEAFLLPSSFQARLSCSESCKLIQTQHILVKWFSSPCVPPAASSSIIFIIMSSRAEKTGPFSLRQFKQGYSQCYLILQVYKGDNEKCHSCFVQIFVKSEVPQAQIMFETFL